jgi:hypothetical protein
MTRYADPQRCPDCAAPITYNDAACPSCALPLRGQTAQRLFEVLSTADELLVTLRSAAPVSVGEATRAGAAGDLDVAAALSVPGTTVAGERPPRAGHGLSAASVPKILLGLGAVCLLVAALVFLAVTWSVMGVGGRTATLVGFTAVTGVLAAWLARRDLRGAAESLSLVSLGLLTMDTFGARGAGWFGDLGTPAFLVLLGGLLAVAGSGAAVAVRRTPVRELLAPEVVAGIGVALLAWGIADSDRLTTSTGLVVAVVLAGLAAGAAHVLGLRLVTLLAAFTAWAAWFAQLTYAIERALPLP